MPEPPRPTTRHYFDADPSVGSERRVVRVNLPDLTIDLVSDRGVFAADRLDAGTKLLLLEAPAPAPGDSVLDLGCGSGAIACVVGARQPRSQVVAVDVNERARELCALNGELLGMTNLTVAAPDEVAPDTTFDVMYSNPPIRIGKRALHDLLLRWLDRLAPTGRAYLVVQRHLGADSLSRWLTDQGFGVHRRCSRQAYRILEVVPRAADARTAP